MFAHPHLSASVATPVARRYVPPCVSSMVALAVRVWLFSSCTVAQWQSRVPYKACVAGSSPARATNAPIAQWIEQGCSRPLVVGSSPTRRANHANPSQYASSQNCAASSKARASTLSTLACAHLLSRLRWASWACLARVVRFDLCVFMASSFWPTQPVIQPFTQLNFSIGAKHAPA